VISPAAAKWLRVATTLAAPVRTDTLPFLIADCRVALAVAVIVVAFELVGLALIRRRLFHTGFVLVRLHRARGCGRVSARG
jgi:hypothetical protein